MGRHYHGDIIGRFWFAVQLGCTVHGAPVPGTTAVPPVHLYQVQNCTMVRTIPLIFLKIEQYFYYIYNMKKHETLFRTFGNMYH
jgi:hypothetical protein